MNRPEPIELENKLGPDAVTGEINRVPWMAYDVDEMDLYIAELEQKLAEKDKEIARQNTEIIEAVKTMNSQDEEFVQLKQKLEDVQASAYADSIDSGMENYWLRKALWLARAERASDKARIFYFAETCGVKLKFK